MEKLSQEYVEREIKQMTIEIAEALQKEMASNKYDVETLYTPIFSPALYERMVCFVKEIDKMPVENELVKYSIKSIKEYLIELYRTGLCISEYSILHKMMKHLAGIVIEYVSLTRPS